MQDPFSPWESRRRVTYNILKTLHEHQYPTIISTKGTLVAREDYLRVLADMNVLVRLSAAGVPEAARAAVDYKCRPFAETLRTAAAVSEAGIPVSLRIQPVIPGCERDALEMLPQAAAAGVRHVSLEFLKVPHERRDLLLHELSEALGSDVWVAMQAAGIKRLGPDYTLDVPWKLEFLRKAKGVAASLGLLIGAGDTELIHLSDGGGCCNGSGALLKGANEFLSNLSGIALREGGNRRIQFADLASRWSPERPVSTYLMTDSRTRDSSGRYSDWFSLVAHRWNGGKGPYSPELFEGVSWTGELDGDGFKIYKFEDPLREDEVDRVR